MMKQAMDNLKKKFGNTAENVDMGRLAACALSFFILIFAIPSCSAIWGSYESKVGGGTVDTWYTLWEYESKGAGVNESGKIKNKIDGNKMKNYKAFELGRFATVWTILDVFIIFCLYAFLALKPMTNVHPLVEYASICSIVLSAVFCFSAAGYWINRQKNNAFVEDTKEETKCDAGCALAIFDSFLLLILASGLLFNFYCKNVNGMRKSSEQKIVPDPRVDVEQGKNPTDEGDSTSKEASEETKEAASSN